VSTVIVNLNVATPGWVDTGLVVTPGQSLKVTASGSVQWSPGKFAFPEGTYPPGYTDLTYPADSSPSAYNPDNVLESFDESGGLFLTHDVPPYALAVVVKEDDGAPPAAGESGLVSGALRPNRATLYTAEALHGGAGGRVWIAFNDNHYADNSGTLVVNLLAIDSGAVGANGCPTFVGITTGTAADVYLVFDVSPSMSSAYGSSTRFAAAKAAIGQALTNLQNGAANRVGLVTFSYLFFSYGELAGTYYQQDSPLTSDIAAVNALVQGHATGGGTGTGTALAAARRYMEAEGNPAHQKILLLVSDGQWNYGLDPHTVITDLKAAHPDWLVYAVDINDGAPNESNEFIGSSVGDGFYSASNPEQLARALNLLTLQAVMKRGFSDAFTAALASETTNLCALLRIERKDGMVLGFTTHDEDLLVDGQLYETLDSVEATVLRQEVGSGIDNMDVAGILSSTRITEDDLRARRYDGATITLFLLDWETLTASPILVRGNFGEVRLTDGKYVAEIRGLMQRLSQQVGHVTQPTCSVLRFCDAQCGLDIADFTYAAEIATTGSARLFTVLPAEGVTFPAFSFRYGIARMTSGDNAGLEREIKDWTPASGTVELQEPFPFLLASGDTLELEVGCDRKLPSCIGFDNAANFRGFPYVPGTDKINARGRPPR
jgi:uncharacterized phage protein (TIGR02218 family)